MMHLNLNLNKKDKLMSTPCNMHFVMLLLLSIHIDFDVIYKLDNLKEQTHS